MQSTRRAAVSAIRRPPQEGQNPRPLHEKATRRSWPQPSQCTRMNPRASTPQSRYARSSRSTNRAAGAPCSRARERNDSSCSRTTSWSSVCAGWRRSYSATRTQWGPGRHSGRMGSVGAFFVLRRHCFIWAARSRREERLRSMGSKCEANELGVIARRLAPASDAGTDYNWH